MLNILNILKYKITVFYEPSVIPEKFYEIIDNNQKFVFVLSDLNHSKIFEYALHQTGKWIKKSIISEKIIDIREVLEMNNVTFIPVGIKAPSSIRLRNIWKREHIEVLFGEPTTEKEDIKKVLYDKNQLALKFSQDKFIYNFHKNVLLDFITLLLVNTIGRWFNPLR